MEKFGREYGQGLQLINVLRDRAADASAGRGYLPEEELAVAPTAEVFARWLDHAEQKLGAGLDYCSALTNWRIRFATVLPALIGARTIALLRATGGAAEKVKVPRKAVRRILAAGALAATAPPGLRGLFRRLLAPPR